MLFDKMKVFDEINAEVSLVLFPDGSGHLVNGWWFDEPEKFFDFNTPEELLSFLDREFFLNEDKILFFDKEAINGITRVKDGKVGFYSVFDGVATLDWCDDGEEKYFKSLEQDLTSDNGKAYCETHSRKLDENNICDICEVWNSAPY